MSQQTHQSDPRILGRRTLEADHRWLAERLRPGMAVLDAGCGTGSITAGIAQRVGSSGYVVGVDRDCTLLAIARQQHLALTNLTFQETDILTWSFKAEFDIVNAARTLQWISDPAAALLRMIAAAKPGGVIVVLDYDHPNSLWVPAPPRSFQSFYHAFLDWRAANGWDNRIAAHLGDLFGNAGLTDVEIHDSDQLKAGAAEDIWLHVIQTIGPKIRAAGFAFDPNAEADYANWLQTDFEAQVLSMKTVIGTVQFAGVSPNKR